MKEDGNAIKYNVTSGNQVIDPREPVHAIADLIDPVHLFDKLVIKSEDYITEFLYPDENPMLDNVYILVHSEFVKKFIEHYDWNYLHYACFFCSTDKGLIEEILENTNLLSNDNLNFATPDKFGRYPLHLACKSGASSEVVEALLAKQEHVATILKSAYLTEVS